MVIPSVWLEEKFFYMVVLATTKLLEKYLFFHFKGVGSFSLSLSFSPSVLSSLSLLFLSYFSRDRFESPMPSCKKCAINTDKIRTLEEINTKKDRKIDYLEHELLKRRLLFIFIFLVSVGVVFVLSILSSLTSLSGPKKRNYCSKTKNYLKKLKQWEKKTKEKEKEKEKRSIKSEKRETKRRKTKTKILRKKDKDTGYHGKERGVW